jgi:diacylglycerol kinase (ATP)
MRAAALLGLGCTAKDLKPFQAARSAQWCVGMPASGDQTDLILLFGGDGTVHHYLGQLVKLGLPVLVVPAGSGNDFACSLGLRRVRDSITAWRNFCDGTGSTRVIDLGVISARENAGGALAPPRARYFCSVAGVGLDGGVARRANRLPRWLRGHGGYLLSLAATIFTFAPLPMKILTPVDGGNENSGWTTRHAQPTLLAAFANTPSYGGGMRIAPQAKMDDGLLDVCIIGSVARFRLLRLVPTVYTGRHLNLPEVEYLHAARVRVETEYPLDVYADGEFVCRTPIDVAVESAALRVVTV